MKKITIVFLFLVSFLSYGQPGNLCSDPIVIGTLPYTVSDNTSNYADLNYEGVPGTPGCGSTNNYLNGNDVIYSYTATFDGSIKLDLDTTEDYSGMFIYDDCGSIGQSCVGGGVNSDIGGVTINEFVVVNGVTYYFVLSTWSLPQTMPYTLNISENTCSNPVATFAVVSDCANGPQFLVDVNLTSLGSAFSVTLSDGTTSQVVSALGTVQVGPYPNGTPITFTLTNDQDSSCVLTSSALNLAVCPPINDLCSGAIDLGALTSPISSTTIGAINDNTPTCDDTGNRPDIYYSVVVPNGSTLKIGQTVNDYDSAVSVFYGDCTNRTVITCFEDPDYTQVEWANTTGADQTVYWVQDGYGTFSPGGTFTLTWSVLACANPIATFSIVSDCAVAPQFYINANVTNLGSATSLTLSDGTTSLQVTSTGSVQVGPYPNGTPKTITLTNNQDATCLITSLPLNQVVCPGPNDECINAISLTVNPSLTCTSVTAGTVAGATASSTSDTACFGTEDDDVWFKFVATGTTHLISLLNVAGSTTDMYHSLWTGSDCTTLTLVPGTCSDANASTPTGLTAGTTYYLRVYTWTATVNQNSSFNVCVGTPPPPPSNDNFANAIVLNCGDTVTADTTQATLDEDSAPDGFGTDLDGKNVWYTFTGTGAAQTVNLNLCNSNYDTSVLVYTGSSGNLTLVAANDDDSTCGVDFVSRSKVNFNSDGITTYYITVEGWNIGSAGIFNMSATCTAFNPPAVANQECVSALALNNDNVAISSDNSFGTVSSAQPGCDIFGTIQDVWFSFVAPASGNLECTVVNATMTSANFIVYSGTCTGLVEVLGSCNSNLTASTTENLTGLIPGNTYYVQVWSNTSEQGTFTIKMNDRALASSTFDSASFTAYPNPVTDKLNLTYSKNIDKVQVINLLGQEVFTRSINATNTELDLSNLTSGTYLVKVSSDNQVKTIKVVKQ